ncbi:aminotransferase class I/II-fold pyridoxal phosphate-dependent enzyme [Marinicella litoralis]|uniref:histidinol-phosphate transaminase n=1 Tax=Marinicella litoralis TaxID=644220 RepID=A0A4R6XV99_9GAMM|nr:aminotransferase class I/II-fold pyridoxal phosphate-dependent enzyme [Marinicella litoralis]TDR20378.1 histidinol-phosphate aminotransferase [Marinicella litoralis]
MKNTSLKLDFNERADSQPAWLKSFQLNVTDLWRYPDRTELENQMASDMGLTPGSVMLSNGGDESIELLYKHSKLNSYALLIPEPCFSQYTHNQRVWQNDTVFTPACDDLSIDTKTLKDNMSARQWVVLTRPNNPTGEYLAVDVLLDLIETAQQKGAWVFLDEAYVEFANEDSPIDYTAYDNLVTLRTFSKAFGLAGARIGYLFGTPQMTEQFRKIAMPFNVSRANLQLAVAAWQAKDEIKAYCQTIANNRETVKQLLSNNGLKSFASKGNFLLFETNPMQKQLFAAVMRKRRIQIKTELAGLPNAIRITIPENITSLTSALQLVLAPEVLAFDMDGVLIDTSKSYDQCIIQTVAILTGQSVNQTDIEVTRAKGGFNNDWVLAAELVKQQGVEVAYESVVETFQKLYLGDDLNLGLVAQEQNLLLDPLKQQLFNSQPITAIVTGRPRKEAEQGVAQLNIKPKFIISADDVKAQKPDPEGLFKVLSATQADRAWFCGDTVDDMQAGTQAGCVCIGIGANTAAATENLYQAGADVVLENINQLETLL